MSSPDLPQLPLDSLPIFRYNKPYKDQLYGKIAGSIALNNRYQRLFLMSAPNQDTYAKHIDDLIFRSADSDNTEVEADTAELVQLAVQVQCVASLARLIERGPAHVAMPREETPTSTTLNDFVQQFPHLFIVARQAEQAGKEPLYVAKIEAITQRDTDHSTPSTPIDIIVSDVSGQKGHMPRRTRDWKLAHLATAGTIETRQTFPYIGQDYRQSR